MQNTEDTIAKYAVDDNRFRLGNRNKKEVAKLSVSLIVRPKCMMLKVKFILFSLNTIDLKPSINQTDNLTILY